MNAIIQYIVGAKYFLKLALSWKNESSLFCSFALPILLCSSIRLLDGGLGRKRE